MQATPDGTGAAAEPEPSKGSPAAGKSGKGSRARAASAAAAEPVAPVKASPASSSVAAAPVAEADDPLEAAAKAAAEAIAAAAQEPRTAVADAAAAAAAGAVNAAADAVGRADAAAGVLMDALAPPPAAGSSASPANMSAAAEAAADTVTAAEDAVDRADDVAGNLMAALTTPSTGGGAAEDLSAAAQAAATTAAGIVTLVEQAVDAADDAAGSLLSPLAAASDPAAPTPLPVSSAPKGAASQPPPPEPAPQQHQGQQQHAAAAHGSNGDGVFDFACPICQTTTFKLSAMPSKPQGLSCHRCKRTFSSSEKYVDLTLTSGVATKVYERREWGGTELFRNPLVSLAYERGWRQGFSWAGFPGVDKEYDLAMDYLEPAYGSVLVDMSCGSGLFSRRFARSGKFAGVVAADFSESMLEQTRAYFKQDGTLGGVTPVTLLRADVGRLPFATGSVAGMHAGAALHCWPNPQAALAEISRVLRPGGVFVASTFLAAAAPLGQALGNDDIVRPLNQMDPTFLAVNRQYKWWEEDELRDLCRAVGLEGFTRTRSWRFIMLAVRKPA